MIKNVFFLFVLFLIIQTCISSSEELIDDEDIIIVETRNYYDMFSFKTNWANSWKDSDVW